MSRTDTHLEEKPGYDGWLVSPSILKRAFAALGHAYLALFLLYIPFILLGAFAALIAAVLG